MNTTEIEQNVRYALAEDIASGDISAPLIPKEHQCQAKLTTRERAIFCGKAWAEEVFRQVDSNIRIQWAVNDGDPIIPGQSLCHLQGNSRSLLAGERSALNFLQLLCGIASKTASLVSAIAHTKARLLDTRKTLPGLRYAQKYAVACGGGTNHRMGLYDAILLKENHIAACGSMAKAISWASQQAQDIFVEVEVESLTQLKQVLGNARINRIMLDNFSLDELRRAVAITDGQIPLEASGGISEDNIASIAQTGVDYVSVGLVTKNIVSCDLTLNFF